MCKIKTEAFKGKLSYFFMGSVQRFIKAVLCGFISAYAMGRKNKSLVILAGNEKRLYKGNFM